MDALSDVLGAVRLTGAVFLEMELREHWSYLTAPARKIADVLRPASQPDPSGGSYTKIRRARGRWTSSPARSGCRARRWASASTR